MKNMTRLIGKIQTVIKAYLQQQYGVNDDVFLQQSVDTILTILARDAHYYRRQSASAARANENCLGMAARIVASGTLTLFCLPRDAYRYLTQAGRPASLQTLAWLNGRCAVFESLGERFQAELTLPSVEQLQVELIRETGDFFRHILHILESPSHEPVKITHLNQDFHMTGLKNSTGGLDTLLNTQLLQPYKRESLTANLVEACNKQRGKLYPIQGEEFSEGCTQAQLWVINGQLDALTSLLALNPQAVNTICEAQGNALSKKTLLELALFEVKFSVALKTRLTMVELILKQGPYLYDAQYPVLSIVTNRLAGRGGVKAAKCPEELRELFCQYVIAQRTCAVNARSELMSLLQRIESTLRKIQVTRCQVLLKEFEIPIRICELLKQGYIYGAFNKLDSIVRQESAMDYAEIYEILYTFDEKQKADAEHLRTHGKANLRTRLLQDLQSRVEHSHKMKPGNSAKDLNAAATNSAQDDLVTLHSELIVDLTQMIERYGVVLITKGFNSFQRSEVVRQINADAARANLRPAGLTL